jgi:hypothetical protein
VAGGLGAAMYDHEMDHVPDGAENGGDAQQPERREHEPHGDVGIFDQGPSSAPPTIAGRGSVRPSDSRGQAAALGLWPMCVIAGVEADSSRVAGLKPDLGPIIQ